MLTSKEKEIIEKLVKDINYVYSIPKEEITVNIMEFLLEEDFENIKFMPDYLKDDLEMIDLLDRLISKEGVNFEYIPKDIIKKYPQLLLNNVYIYLSILIYVLDIFREDKNLQIGVLKRTPTALRFIPKEDITKEMVDIVTSFPRGWRLNQIPTQYITYDIALNAVWENGNDIKYVPKDLIDERICVTALNSDASSKEVFLNIPNEFRNNENINLLAVEKYWLNIREIPEEFLTLDICKLAIEKCGKAKAYIPKHILDKLD